MKALKVEKILQSVNRIVEYVLVTLAFAMISLQYTSLFPNVGVFIVRSFMFTLVYMYIFSLITTVNYSFSELIYVVLVTFFLSSVFLHIFLSVVFDHSLLLEEFFVLFIFQYVLLISWKVTMKILTSIFRDEVTVILIGSHEETEEIAFKILSSRKERVKIIGVYNEITSTIFPNIELVDKVIVGNSVYHSIKHELISYSLKHNKTVFLIPEIYDIAVNHSRLIQFDDAPMFEVSKLGLTFGQKRRKRIADIFASSMALLVLSPVFLVVAILIKLQDGGQVFYKQLRLTRNGKEFYVIKFRSMIMNAEKHTGAVFALDKDPRITALGRFLRKTRLDEIPQFINVLKGDMSMIGPRPERPEFYDLYERDIPEFRQRLTVKAGISGLAQVLSNYSTTPADKLIYDLKYIREYSILLDLKIAFQTVRIIFSSSAARGLMSKEELSNKYEAIKKGDGYDNQ